MFSLMGSVLIGNANNDNVAIFIALVLSYILSFSIMICWGFVTGNRKNILFRIVRPWQVGENTEFNTYSV